jgi:putative spermidine/putrescine transport system permease protein
VAGSVVDANGNLTLSNFAAIDKPFILKAFQQSIVISAVSAVIGGIFGALLAYAVATGNREGFLRRTVMSAAGVIAQFGGVSLVFAFIATLGTTGFVYLFFLSHGVDIYKDGVWLYELNGLTFIYLYFQIPLMVLVFIPALDGIRPQWREATESLGGNTWHYWRYVAGPLLLPSFLGCTLLLFANAFSAYATAAVLMTNGAPLVSLQIQAFLTSETGSASPGIAKALALAMIVVVLLVMSAYTLLQRRTSQWLR